MQSTNTPKKPSGGGDQGNESDGNTSYGSEDLDNAGANDMAFEALLEKSQFYKKLSTPLQEQIQHVLEFDIDKNDFLSVVVCIVVLVERLL